MLWFYISVQSGGVRIATAKHDGWRFFKMADSRCEECRNLLILLDRLLLSGRGKYACFTNFKQSVFAIMTIRLYCVFVAVFTLYLRETV